MSDPVRGLRGHVGQRRPEVKQLGNSKMGKLKHAAAWIMPALAVAGYAGHARADEQMVLVAKIDVQSAKGIATFDISFVDPKIGLYVLADRTNASVDFFNARDATFTKRVGGFAGQKFQAHGKTADNTISG